MTDALRIAVATLLCLGIVAAVVGPGRDSTILSAPPEAVAESFVRDLVARRFDLAMEYVDDTSGVSLTTVRLAGNALHARAPEAVANDVQGDRSTIAGERAEAQVHVRAPNTGLQVRVVLVRRDAGVWRVTDWNDR